MKNHPAGLSFTVNRPNGCVESFQVMNAIDESPLPSALKIEVKDWCISEVKRDPTLLYAGKCIFAISGLETESAMVGCAGLKKTGSLGDWGHHKSFPNALSFWEQPRSLSSFLDRLIIVARQANGTAGSWSIHGRG
jgi:hypothetical protein